MYGSRFVQSYCDVISEDPSLDENEMRHRVNAKMDRWPTADPRDIQVRVLACNVFNATLAAAANAAVVVGGDAIVEHD